MGLKRQILLFVLLSAFLAGTATHSSASDNQNNSCEFDLKYEINIPGKTKLLRLTITLPRTLTDRQKVFVSYSPRPFRSFRKNGNRYAEFVFRNKKGKFNITAHVKAEISRYDLSTARKKDNPNLSKGPAFQSFIRHEEYIEKNDPLIQQIAKTITGQTEVEIVKSIYDYVADNMQYTSMTDEKGALYAAKTKTGDCSEYSYLFAALCRAKKIPARVVSGYVTYSTETPMHARPEVYLKKYGWVPFEPTWGDREDKSVHEKRFASLRPLYVNRTYIRNDKFLNSHVYYSWRYVGDKVAIEDSVEFKQAKKQNNTKQKRKKPADS